MHEHRWAQKTNLYYQLLKKKTQKILQQGNFTNSVPQILGYGTFLRQENLHKCHILPKCMRKFHVYSIIVNKTFPDVYSFFLQDLNRV